MKDSINIVALEGKQDFSKIWPSDLLFYLIPPMIELDWDIMKTNIQSKSEEDVAPTVLTRFYLDLT